MNTLFNPDNPFWNFVGKIVGLCVLSMLFTLCCIPIVTIGPACAALYYAVVKSIRRERGYPATEFLHAFRDNLKKGIPITLILLALAAMLFFTDIPLIFGFINTGTINNTLTLVLFILKVVLLLGVSAWIFPFMSRFEQKIPALFGYALLFMIRNIFSSLVLIVFLVLVIFVIAYEILFLAFVPGLAALLMSFTIEPTLQKACDRSELDESKEDLWFLGR